MLSFEYYINIVEYYVKAPYLVSYWVDMMISQLAVSQSETMNF